jgi:hypothetical protein
VDRNPVTPYSVAGDHALGAFVTSVHRQGDFLASDAAWIFRIENGLPVRHLHAGYRACNRVEEQVERLDAIGRTRPLKAVLTKLTAENPCRRAWAHHLERAGFSIVFESANAAVYSRTHAR